MNLPPTKYERFNAAPAAELRKLLSMAGESPSYADAITLVEYSAAILDGKPLVNRFGSDDSTRSNVVKLGQAAVQLATLALSKSTPVQGSRPSVAVPKAETPKPATPAATLSKQERIDALRKKINSSADPSEKYKLSQQIRELSTH